MNSLAPYLKPLAAMTVDTSRLKRRKVGSFVSKLREEITIAAFSVTNVWRGSSEIVTRFIFPKTSNFSIRDIEDNIPSNPNYVLAVSWYSNNITYRYKLWSGIGEVFWAPLYNGESIGSDTFALEVWSTNTTPIVGDGITFLNSRLIIPTSKCDTANITSTASQYECGDPLFHFTVDGFNPSQGDYYIFQDYCTRIIVHGSVQPIAFPYNILQSSDSTWHYVWTNTIDDNTYIFIDQTDATPPVGALGYFPMIWQQDQTKTFRIDLRTMPDSPTTHAIRIGPQILSPEPTAANVTLLPNQQDALYYGLILMGDDINNLFINVNQAP